MQIKLWPETSKNIMNIRMLMGITKHYQWTFFLMNILKKGEVPWELVYNVDEKGIQMGGVRKNSQQ
ncbi:uncharacterized protein C8R40DRAFT_1200134 [Lentinula edodes]|uniref:uncharacterized protein n=1 Tax=Lentinula edodes TaxID=5353 RepID=UPI001E8D1597|nr:uncharacterized protein C8R40DRAFT_1200134 [Lentinula edodes]KAH7872869.1 hypothetical protein C8R40DRAFT_1200134 [Lentinula edodes]